MLGNKRPLRSKPWNEFRLDRVLVRPLRISRVVSFFFLALFANRAFTLVMPRQPPRQRWPSRIRHNLFMPCMMKIGASPPGRTMEITIYRRSSHVSQTRILRLWQLQIPHCTRVHGSTQRFLLASRVLNHGNMSIALVPRSPTHQQGFGTLFPSCS
jgi:hypothetical protein